MLNVKEKIDAVYTAHSKHNFYARRIISAYVLEKDKLPLNPFTNWDYFMDDMVDRKLTMRGNNNLIYLADEIWQFGVISNGCYHEIKLAMELKKRIKFFAVGKTLEEIKPIEIDDLQFEKELIDEIDVDELKKELNEYVDVMR
ncbi:MAG TPA: hypothetical protein DCY94_05260 [Firmicutes bacterium]|nr:hypothetical protein [Bacillota bacterium]